MRRNVKRGSAPSPRKQQVIPTSSPEIPIEPAGSSPRQDVEPRPAGSSAEDWDNPSTHPRMSAIWPVLWIGVPLLLLVLYGMFSGR